MGIKDITKNEKEWKKFKENKYDLKKINPKNRTIISDFLKDFELGINTPPKKRGARKPGTLLKLKYFLVSLDRHFPNKAFIDLTKEDVHLLCEGMFQGRIKTCKGRIYKDVGEVVKNLKTFFRWAKRSSNINESIVEDLSAASYKRSKPAWTYLEHADIKKLIDSTNAIYKPLMLFLFDSGLRPEEAIRIKVRDFKFYADEPAILNIPEFRGNGMRVSKTFERTIKLMNCSNQIKNYIELNGLKPNDLLIQKSRLMFNRYLKRLALKLFGNVKTKSRGEIKDINMYAFRHWSSIYWLDRYKTNKDLMYRMGWKNEDKILYYSEFLGRRDKIDEDDMVTMDDKNKYEKNIEKLKKQEAKNLQLLKKLSLITQVLLNTAMEDKNTKEKIKNQLIGIQLEGVEANPLKVIHPSD
jgi:integrase